MSIYLLEKHSKFGIDYDLYELENVPSIRFTKKLRDNWYKTYSGISGVNFSDCKNDDRVYIQWCGETAVGYPIPITIIKGGENE